MKITVKPLGYLRKYFEDYIKENDVQVDLVLDKKDLSVKELLILYKVDTGKVGFVLCNDNLINMEYKLQDGDKITLIIPIAGG